MVAVLDWMLGLMVGLGVCVVSTYAYLFVKYVGWFGFVAYKDNERRLLWACFYEGWNFVLWLFSVPMCVVAFLFFSIWMQTGGYPTTYEGDPSWVLGPYSFFLLFSGAYVPLVLWKQNKLVIVVLFCVAVSTVLLLAWTCTLDMSVPTNAVLCFFVAWLAFHCTCLDFVWWGSTWYVGMQEHELAVYSALSQPPVLPSDPAAVPLDPSVLRMQAIRAAGLDVRPVMHVVP